MTIDKSATTYVAGHRGLVGSAIWRRLEADGFTNLVGRTSAEVDLRDRQATFDLLSDVRPRYLILAAARVGGILANDQFPAEFLSDNLRVQVNVMDASHEMDVERLVFLGSSCIYPKLSPQPIKEEYLMTGPLEPTNDAYAIAKIAGILQVQSARKQYGRRWVSAMPTNLYGPGDSFSPTTSHVLPALIRRYVEAKETGLERVTNWGSGTPRREFLHVDDLARAIALLLEEYDSPEPINVGTGRISRSARSPNWSPRSSGTRVRSTGTRPSPMECHASCSTSRASRPWAGARRRRSRTGCARPSSGTTSTEPRSARSARSAPVIYRSVSGCLRTYRAMLRRCHHVRRERNVRSTTRW